jgi:hypothetical protein
MLITNDKGRRFFVRFVYQGERYGLNDCLTHKEPEPMVEFYDDTYSEANGGKFGERGQFVSRYSTSVLAAWSGSGNAGICLDGGNREAWSVNAEALRPVIDECVKRTTKRHPGSTPCPLCCMCEDCKLIVHADKPTMHRGSCLAIYREEWREAVASGDCVLSLSEYVENKKP